MTVLDERDAPRSQTLAFPWLLQALSIPAGCRALDVGAGGFEGKSTTVHLHALGAYITAVEIDPGRAAVLRRKFPDIGVIVSDIRQYDYREGPFDLAVFDLDTGLTPAVMRELIPRARDHLSSAGLVITMLVYDSVATYSGEEPLLASTGRKFQEDFLGDFYGATRVGVGAASRALQRHGFEVLGVVDKYLGSSRRGVGWLILRKMS